MNVVNNQLAIKKDSIVPDTFRLMESHLSVLKLFKLRDWSSIDMRSLTSIRENTNKMNLFIAEEL